jgi:hypothetical protein
MNPHAQRAVGSVSEDYGDMKKPKAIIGRRSSIRTFGLSHNVHETGDHAFRRAVIEIDRQFIAVDGRDRA